MSALHHVHVSDSDSRWGSIPADQQFWMWEGETRFQRGDARYVKSLLEAAYPGHPWKVTVKGGVIFIRYIMLGTNKPWGMNLKVKSLSHDARVLKSEVLRAAGEWLERAGLRRSGSDGSLILRVDGIPDSDQPHPAAIAAEQYWDSEAFKRNWLEVLH